VLCRSVGLQSFCLIDYFVPNGTGVQTRWITGCYSYRNASIGSKAAALRAG
jgi:hypothetical protein